MEAEGSALDIEMVTASLRADSSDLRSFVEALAVKLEEAVPGGVRVERRREGMFGPKLVRTISLDAGDQRLELAVSGSDVQTRCARLSGGIVLKSQTLDTDAWLTLLAEALAVQARRSETTRRALDRLLNG
jgi:uncharacterized protein YhdP